MELIEDGILSQVLMLWQGWYRARYWLQEVDVMLLAEDVMLMLNIIIRDVNRILDVGGCTKDP